jgi:predicted acylesterase/phospholipase RssA
MTKPLVVRRMPLLAQKQRESIFQRMPVIRERIIKCYENNAMLVCLAKSISRGNAEGVLSVLSAHPVCRREMERGNVKNLVGGMLYELSRFYREDLSALIDDKEFTQEEILTYHKKKEAFVQTLSTLHSSLLAQAPASVNLVLSALNVLPGAVVGQERENLLSSKISWIGERVTGPVPAGKIALVLSGGAARGVFYVGFMRALREADFWPDLVVGTSAGAIAAASLAAMKTQEEIDQIFSSKQMRRMFSPLYSPLAFFGSAGSGILGHGLGKTMKKYFGNARFSDVADCFVVSAVQQPVNFGKAVIGRASMHNGGTALSSDIELYKGVWGSSAMQGIIPQPDVKPFTAERLVRDFGVVRPDGIELPYATLDDGGVIENLPLETAAMLLDAQQSMVIAVNLLNMNPLRTAFGPDGRPFLEKLKYAGSDLLHNPKAFFGKSAFVRGYLGLEHALQANMEKSIDMAKGKGNAILVNPNCDGSLDGIDLVRFRGARAIREYGYELGKELMGILNVSP